MSLLFQHRPTGAWYRTVPGSTLNSPDTVRLQGMFRGDCFEISVSDFERDYIQYNWEALNPLAGIHLETSDAVEIMQRILATKEYVTYRHKSSNTPVRVLKVTPYPYQVNVTCQVLIETIDAVQHPKWLTLSEFLSYYGWYQTRCPAPEETVSKSLEITPPLLPSEAAPTPCQDCIVALLETDSVRFVTVSETIRAETSGKITVFRFCPMCGAPIKTIPAMKVDTITFQKGTV